MSSIRILKTFLAVAAEGSFTAAAQRIALTQAAVGLQMRTLEAEMHRPLFERHGKSMTLSAAGYELLPEVRRLVEDYERIAEAPHPDRSMSGTIRIGIVNPVMQPFIRCLIDLRRAHASLLLKVSTARPVDLVQRVAKGELDAAIATRVATSDDEDLTWLPLYDEPMILLAPRAFPVASPRDMLRDFPYIGFDPREPTGALIQRTLKRLRVKPQRVVEITSTEAIVSLIGQGMGVAILPRLHNSDWHLDPALRVIELPPGTETRSIALVFRKSDSARAATLQAIAEKLLRSG